MQIKESETELVQINKPTNSYVVKSDKITL